jgi:hypothetical protein
VKPETISVELVALIGRPAPCGDWEYSLWLPATQVSWIARPLKAVRA